MQTLLIYVGVALSFAAVLGPIGCDFVARFNNHLKLKRLAEERQTLKTYGVCDATFTFRKIFRGQLAADGRVLNFTMIKERNSVRWTCGVDFVWDVPEISFSCFSSCFKIINSENLVSVNVFLDKTNAIKIVSIE